jgi:hypothetical protein
VLLGITFAVFALLAYRAIRDSRRARAVTDSHIAAA